MSSCHHVLASVLSFLVIYTYTYKCLSFFIIVAYSTSTCRPSSITSYSYAYIIHHTVYIHSNITSKSQKYYSTRSMVRVSCRARTEHSRTVCRLCLCLCIVQVRTVESLTSEGLHELIDINTGRFRIVLGFKILNETKQHMTRIIKVKQTDAWALSPWRQHGQTSGSQPNYARLIVPRTQS